MTTKRGSKIAHRETLKASRPHLLLPDPAQEKEHRHGSRTYEHGKHAGWEFARSEYDAADPVGKDDECDAGAGRAEKLRTRTPQTRQIAKMRGKQADEAHRSDNERRGGCGQRGQI